MAAKIRKVLHLNSDSSHEPSRTEWVRIILVFWDQKRDWLCDWNVLADLVCCTIATGCSWTRDACPIAAQQDEQEHTSSVDRRRADRLCVRVRSEIRLDCVGLLEPEGGEGHKRERERGEREREATAALWPLQWLMGRARN